MNIRETILKEVAKERTVTIDDLIEITGLQRKQLHDNGKSAIKDGLLDRIKDDVTGQPAYELTAKGREWLTGGAGRVTTQAGRGASIPGTAAQETSLVSDFPPGAAATKKPTGDARNKPSPVAVEKAVVNESFTTEMPTDKACCNAAKVVATTAGAEVAELNTKIADMAQMIDAATDDVRRQVQRACVAEASRDDIARSVKTMGEQIVGFCEWLHSDYSPNKCPLHLHEAKEIIDDIFNEMNAEITRLLAENIALKSLNEAMPGFGKTFSDLAQADMPQGFTLKPPAPAKFAYILNTDLHDSPDAAAQDAADECLDDEINNAIIVRIHPVGRVEIKPVFVPIEA
jgi:hypothetical protein